MNSILKKTSNFISKLHTSLVALDIQVYILPLFYKRKKHHLKILNLQLITEENFKILIKYVCIKKIHKQKSCVLGKNNEFHLSNSILSKNISV